jgi:trans-aconitate methyltransferase
MISRVLPPAEREVLRYDLPGRKRQAVDFGCHTGWFSRQLARAGWSVIGIDRSPEWLAIARACNELLRGPNVPEFWSANLSAPDFAPPAADVGLFLSVAMYTFEDIESGWRLLERISRRVEFLFFDFGGMYAGRVPFTKDTAVDAITSRTLYKHGTLLGESDNGRPMFLFEK